jgi:hypothetical protein
VPMLDVFIPEGRCPPRPSTSWSLMAPGGRRRINMLADIAGFALGDREQGRAYAEQALAGRRGVPVGG